jgi:carboxy-terminal domain RNA polymerase II polypeptide A small phosphatase
LERNASKILVVLDLDETLVHATAANVEGHDFELFGYKIFRRPYLEEFLAFLPNHFKVAVWSSASDDYVLKITEKIFPPGYPLEFVWGRSSCTFKADYSKLEAFGYFDQINDTEYIKPLIKIKKRLNHPLERIIVIDDTPRKAMLNYGNAIYPAGFKGERDDQELLLLMQYLDTLKDHPNVRKIEKRFWKNKIAKKN